MIRFTSIVFVGGQVTLKLSEDGSGIGAALVAAVVPLPKTTAAGKTAVGKAK